MTGFVNLGGGQRRPIGLRPANTAEATMFTAGKERPSVVGIIVANETGGAVAATLKWGDGSTDYRVLAAKSIGANDVYVLDGIFIPLKEGYTIKVTSGSGNALTFTLIIAEGGSSFGN